MKEASTRRESEAMEAPTLKETGTPQHRVPDPGIGVHTKYDYKNKWKFWLSG